MAGASTASDEDVLYRRIAQEWGFGRVAARIRSTIKSALPQQPRKLIHTSDPVFWPKDADAENYTIFRVDGDASRKFEDIPPIELCNAAMEVLEKHICFPEEGFPQEIARQFGAVRVTQKMADYCQESIDHLLESGILARHDGSYSIANADRMP